MGKTNGWKKELEQRIIMTTILFERNLNVYLPELAAYKDYIKKNLPDLQAFDSSDLQDYDPKDFDVIWRFMGTDRKGEGRRIIHEYNSLSTPPFASFKNKIKKLVNVRPYARIFLNHAVQKGFFFKDSVPFLYRDMGINHSFLNPELKKAEYDFVYAGSLDRGKIVFSILNHFLRKLTKTTLLIIGSVPDEIYARYKNAQNIIFTGRVPYEQMPSLMGKARYGLNLMPDRYPFNVQTATKVLEYCAMGLPIVSSSYRWIRDFEKERDAKFFYLSSNLDNFNLRNIESFAFQTPCVSDYEWEKVITQSNVFSLLKH